MHKLTMATPWGCFSYRVMPFGIVNGPACFSRVIYLVMQDYIDNFVTTYIDDIKVYSQDFDARIDHIHRTLQKLLEVNMVVKPSKAALAREEVEVLGFLVSKDGIKPCVSNVEKIKNFPRPKNKTDVRAFAALSGFYRRRINCFSDIIAPMNDLLKKTVPFKWTERQEKAFTYVKQSIVNATQLKYPDPHAKYKIYCDASDLGIGGVLTQFDEKKQEERPVCFMSVVI